MLNRIPTWIAAAASTSTALGLVVYSILRVDYSLFYGRFGLKPEDVGLSQLEIVSQALALLLTFGVVFFLELLVLGAYLWILARGVRKFFRALRSEERENVLFGAAVLLALLLAFAIARSELGLWAVLACVGAFIVLVGVDWSRLARDVRRKTGKPPRPWRSALRVALEVTAARRSSLLIVTPAMAIGFIRNWWATLLVLVALFVFLRLILGPPEQAPASFSPGTSREPGARGDPKGGPTTARSEEPGAQAADLPGDRTGPEKQRAGLLSMIATRGTRRFLIALFAITIVLLEVVLAWGATLDAELVQEGRVVQGTAGPGVAIVSWSARPAAISWMSGPPKGLEDVADHCLLYLGQGGGTAVFFDHDAEQTVRIPSGALVISVDASAGQGERVC